MFKILAQSDITRESMNLVSFSSYGDLKICQPAQVQIFRFWVYWMPDEIQVMAVCNVGQQTAKPAKFRSSVSYKKGRTPKKILGHIVERADKSY